MAITRRQTLSRSTLGGTLLLDPDPSNLLVAVTNERSGRGHATHTITVGGTSMTKLAGWDIEIEDANARHSVALWMLEGVSVAGRQVVVDAGGDSCGVMFQEFENAGNTDYWNFLEVVQADTGLGSDSPITTPLTSQSYGDVLLIASLASRNQGAAWPTGLAFTNINIGNVTDQTDEGEQKSNGRWHGSGYLHDLTSSAKQTTASWGGSGHESAAVLAVFGKPPTLPPFEPLRSEVAAWVPTFSGDSEATP